ncbi:hypothetical protein [Paludibacterium paludis]|uniref:MarR family transcriptional regulator n=1 Tax=Paludibacterium paludis TaxID=1225769 RepID=A0A918UA21_9NEIS|nr:hypothetical protein [Paludibacterium paludis]GGY15259.1 hypothetical protein GCM10011289_18070 [Paludibacterium paludis]
MSSEEDARSLLVQLTDVGFELIEGAVAAHVANEQAILSGLSARNRDALDRQLTELLSSLE